MAKTIHLVSVLDRSGSMHGTEAEVIGAYNAFIEKQAKIAEEKDVKMKASLFLFDNTFEEIYKKVPIHSVGKLTDKVYTIRGMTALYDAVGKTINEFQDKKNVIMFIETDGFENSSKEFNGETIKKLVEQKTKDGWDFNFVGADLTQDDVIKMGTSLGIKSSKTMAFNKSHEGYATRNMEFASATMSYIDSRTEK